MTAMARTQTFDRSVADGWKADIALPFARHRLMGMKQRQLEVLDFLLDDHFALWDFADTFPSQRPDALNASNGELLERIKSGHVALTYGRWSDNRTQPIPAEQADGPLKDPANWQPYGKNAGYALELTQKGRQHLQGVGIGLPKP